ncbi:MAG TPA: IPT/TIG domain-containing protein [Solirubrobacteraceae bacterium]
MGASTSAAAPYAKGFRVARVCPPPAPGRATCMALRLVPSSLTASDLKANKARYRRAAAHREKVPALRKKPFPGFLTPERLHAAYSLPNETPTSSTQTIAVVDAFNDPTIEEDLAVYDKEFGLSTCTTANGCFKKINQNGKASPLPEDEGGWGTEISIDVEMARAICQNCRIVLVETSSEEFSDLGAGVNAAVNAGATVISNSYGGPEEPGYLSLASADYNHPGLLVAASTGDCGYFNKACRGRGQAANFPADSPNVLAVGGTSLTENGKGEWTSAAWDEGGSGCSTLFSAALWQAEAANFSATGCKGGRGEADVSAIGDPNTGVDIYDSTPEELGAPTGWGVWGGTSVAAPIVTAEFALAGGARGVNYPASTLYSHLGQANDLYDVTAGNNGSCGTTTICKAAVGFDGPTGVGSPIGLGALVLGETPANTSAPVISGEAAPGGTLKATTGEWTGSPTAFGYQWERCTASEASCATIATASSSSYAVTSADVGSRLRVKVTASNGVGSGTPATSAQTAVVASSTPTIGSFTPSGITGSTIVIEGSGLAGATQVLLGKQSMSFTVVSAAKIEAIIPNGAAAGKLQVNTPQGSAKSKGKLNVTFSIKSFKPGSGGSGTAVTIKGVGFNGSSVVKFDGVQATVLSRSSSKLKVTVPEGAGTGPITITNTTSPAGTITSSGNFKP